MERRLLLAAVVLGLSASVTASPLLAALETKTLRREHDPVIVRTGLLADLPDRQTAQYRLYTMRDGRLEPIPFQFDACGPDGEPVLSENGAESDFTFDDDDELVFMAKDTGDRAPIDALPAPANLALEFAVADRNQTGTGWVYLVYFPANPPPRSRVRYATFDTARQEAHALTYDVSYSHDRSNFLRHVRIPPRAGGTGETLIERWKIRMSPTFSFLWTTFRPTLSEENFTVIPDGVKNGPVRAIRRVRQSIDLGRLFPDIPNGRVYTYYYASSFWTPSRFSLPWLALKTLRDVRFESVHAFGSHAGDMRYWDAANPDGVPFDGSQRPAASDADHDWWIVSGTRGTYLHTLAIPEEWRAWGVKRGIVFVDLAEAAAGDGLEPGAGYSLLRMTSLRRAGSYALGSTFVVLSRPYRPGDEAEALGSFRNPLTTKVRMLGATD